MSLDGMIFIVSGLSITGTSVMDILRIFQEKLSEKKNIKPRHIECYRLVLTRDKANPSMGPCGAMERSKMLFEYGIGGEYEDDSKIAATFIVIPRIPGTGSVD